jgi:3-oxoacyl-[acyl-carrier-protein] synthase-1
MNEVYILADHLITSLGTNKGEVWQRMLANETGVKRIENSSLFVEPFWASLVETDLLEKSFAGTNFTGDFTRFEKMTLLSAFHAIKQSGIDPSSSETVFILSTTKGNIDLLEKDKKDLYNPERLYLWHTARMISSVFGNKNEPLVISNACISGVLALITASDYLRSGYYKNAVVIGADIASEFVISGFQSFKSLSNGPCKPFDLNRDGLNLGEGAGTIVLSSDPALVKDDIKIRILGGATGNDANHISGPSRTGEGLYIAVKHAMDITQTKAADIGFISAHGTATSFNDEMESKAFAWAGLSHAPLNSMKGYFGHALGAAGVIETVISIQSLRKNILLKTLGYSEYGVPDPINILASNVETNVNCCLKTASGFGGCNAALIIRKD